MIFDDQFQLVQLLRCLSSSPVSAVAYDQNSGFIAAAYESTIEIFELRDLREEEEGSPFWRRIAFFSVDFPIFSLAWNCKGNIEV